MKSSCMNPHGDSYNCFFIENMVKMGCVLVILALEWLKCVL